MTFYIMILSFFTAAVVTGFVLINPLQAQSTCSRCNIVEEGLFNQSLVNKIVYNYDRQSNKFAPIVVTAVFREGPFYVIRWYDSNSGRYGKDDATNYYSYRSMQQFLTAGKSSQPPLSQSQNQEKTGWIASCAMAQSDNVFMAVIGRRGCCESTAASRYGPHPICR